MHIVAFAASIEVLDNYIDALRLIVGRGGRCEIVYLASIGAVLPSEINALGFPVRIVRSGGGAVHSSKPSAPLEEMARAIVGEDPDVFFHCDSQSTSAGLVTQLLRDLKYRGLIIGGQGSVAPHYVENLNADRLICFGSHEISRLRVGHQASAYAAGLPRLDRLRDLPTSRSGFGVFLARRFPEAPIIDATLSAFEANCGMPIVVCAQSEHAGIYRHKPSLTLPPCLLPTNKWSITEHLQHCNFVVATDATTVIDALYLGKLTILLPNAGLQAFDHYPGISEGFSPAAINDAASRFAKQPRRVADFLEDMVGGVRYDHSESVFTALVRLVGSGPLRKVNRQALQSAPANSTPALQKISTRVELINLIPFGGKAAELGVAKGAFSDEMLRARDDFQLYSIDRWAGDRGHDSSEFTEACELLGRHGSRSTVVRKSFDDALEIFAPGSLDLVYIDGYAHDGQQGGKTLEDWWSRLKPGGIFAGHDYHPDWKATMDAVDGFCRARGLRIETTSADFFPSWFVRKPACDESNSREAVVDVVAVQD